MPWCKNKQVWFRARGPRAAVGGGWLCALALAAACGSSSNDGPPGTNAGSGWSNTALAGSATAGQATAGSGVVAGSRAVSGGAAGSAGVTGAAGSTISVPQAGRAGSGTAGMMAAAAGMGMSGASGTSSAAGTAGASGAAGGTGAAGATVTAGTGGAGPIDVMDCGQGGMVGKASNEGGGSGRSYGMVQFTASSGNQITRLQTTLEVPVKPNGSQTLFIWPGLEPLGDTGSIGTGVLQPVLTWFGSCAPGSPQMNTGMWWISGQYVNTLTSNQAFKGCHGGKILYVGIGDKLAIDFSLQGTTWTQTITDQANGKSVDFAFDLQGQAQRWAIFDIELPTSTKPASDVVFTNTVITMAKPEAKACQPSTRGTNDYFSAPVSSADGLRCCVARIVLRAQGVAATTMP